LGITLITGISFRTDSIFVVDIPAAMDIASSIVEISFNSFKILSISPGFTARIIVPEDSTSLTIDVCKSLIL